MAELKEILKERGNRYGNFKDNAQIAQDLKQSMEKMDGWYELPANQREAMHQIASKFSRIITGDYTYEDNWRDVEGYAKLVADSLVTVSPEIKPSLEGEIGL